jgi:hypothetical protein
MIESAPTDSDVMVVRHEQNRTLKAADRIGQGGQVTLTNMI